MGTNEQRSTARARRPTDSLTIVAQHAHSLWMPCFCFLGLGLPNTPHRPLRKCSPKANGRSPCIFRSPFFSVGFGLLCTNELHVAATSSQESYTLRSSCAQSEFYRDREPGQHRLTSDQLPPMERQSQRVRPWRHRMRRSGAARKGQKGP